MRIFLFHSYLIISLLLTPTMTTHGQPSAPIKDYRARVSDNLEIKQGEKGQNLSQISIPPSETKEAGVEKVTWEVYEAKKRKKALFKGTFEESLWLPLGTYDFRFILHSHNQVLERWVNQKSIMETTQLKPPIVQPLSSVVVSTLETNKLTLGPNTRPVFFSILLDQAKNSYNSKPFNGVLKTIKTTLHPYSKMRIPHFRHSKTIRQFSDNLMTVGSQSSISTPEGVILITNRNISANSALCKEIGSITRRYKALALSAKKSTCDYLKPLRINKLKKYLKSSLLFHDGVIFRPLTPEQNNEHHNTRRTVAGGFGETLSLSPDYYEPFSIQSGHVTAHSTIWLNGHHQLVLKGGKLRES